MGTGVGEAMLIGAMTGAGTSAVTGGDPLKGALLGAAGGGIGAGVGGALGGQAASAAVPGATATGGAAGGAGGAAGGAGGAAGGSAAGTMLPSAFDQAVASQLGSGASTGVTAGLGPTKLAAQTGQMVGAPAVPQVGFKDLMTSGGDFSTKLGNYLVQNPMQVGGASGVIGGISSFDTPELPGVEKYSGPLSRFRYDPDEYTPYMASGGLADSAVAKKYMRGGHLGAYSDGGRLTKGPGDGMSDDIPAKIGAKQPARLADGEFVIPADVVSGIGNGSTDAGARKLYAMMDKVRKARTGTKRQGKEINPSKYMPA
jgi:hypothetical protein